MKKILLFLFIISAGTFKSFSQDLNLKLEANLSYGSENLSNIWSWKDPQDGKEYALVGAEKGMSVVDVSIPSSPKKIIQIPGPNSIWREIRTNGNYAYIVTEGGGGLQIVDLSNLPGTNLTTTTWTPTISGGVLSKIHALQIDNGKIYLYGSSGIGKKGAIIADIATNPMAPKFLGLYDASYVHDGYVRNDTMYSAHIFDGNFSVVDARNPAAVKVLAIVKTPTAFTHNTWLTHESRYLLTTDENANSFLGSFDLADLNNIKEVDRIQPKPGSGAFVHNTYVIKKLEVDFAVTSWYSEGVIICDASRPWNLVQVGNYDTSPGGPSGESNDWGVDPYLPSGIIVASDMSNGLFVFSPTYVRACFLEGIIYDCNTGNPLSGAQVQILKAPAQNVGSATDLTDAQGKYGVGVVTAASYSVVVSKAGYISQTFAVSLSNGNVTPLNVNLCKTVGTNDLENLDKNVLVSPNPFSSSTTIKMLQNNSTVFDLNVYDIYGRKVKSTKFAGSIKVDRENLSDGIYFYKITDNENIIGAGKLVID